MKKRLLSVALLMGTMAANAQVGIGTATPHRSAELLIESNNRGLLIPNVALTTTKDKTTITNGNVQSLLVYATKAQGDITPGYYYWDISVWRRLTADADIPAIVVNQFENILKLEGDKVTNLIKNLIKANETLTVLGYDKATGVLTYTDEAGKATTVDVKGAVKSFETVTSITTDAAKGTITFKDEAGKDTVLDIKALVKANETVTTLVREEAGKYTYTNEAGTESKITVIGDLTEVIKGKTDADLYNILKQLVNVEQTLTKLVYNTTSRQLAYTDEQNATHNIDVDALVKENQTVTTLAQGTNIKVTEVKGANSISYTLDVPTASKDVAGVVKPGSGLEIDKDGNLTVNLETALNGKDLTGNDIIVVTDGKGAVLRTTALSVNEKAIKLENLGGTLNLTQLQTGNAGDVLVVNEGGNVVWSAKDAVTSNTLVLKGSDLVSTVNGVLATQTLKDKLTTEMLVNGSVTAEKLGADKKDEGKVPVVQADGTVVYQNISSTNVDGKALTSANNLLTVSNTAGVVLKDVVLTIDQTKFELNQIGGTLQLTQIEKGGADTVLVTEVGGDGKPVVKWVTKESVVTANETVTSIVDHGNGTFTYTDEKNVPVTFDANTVKVEVKEGVYTFKNKNKEGENVITTINTNAIASGYDNKNSGLTAENVQAAIDELVKKINEVANTKGTLSSTDITVTEGTDALLKNVTLAIAEGAVTTEKLAPGAVTTEKIKAGGADTVLVTEVGADGKPVVKWVTKKDATTNKLEVVGNELVSTVNGVPATADLTQAITTPMLKDGAVTSEKLNAGDTGVDNRVAVADAKGNVTYKTQKEVVEGNSSNKLELSGNTLTSTVNGKPSTVTLTDASIVSDKGIKGTGITVVGGANATLKDVTLEITAGTNKGDVLVTGDNGKVEWVTKKDATSNTLEAKGDKLVSTVNGQPAELKLEGDVILKEGKTEVSKLQGNDLVTTKVQDGEVLSFEGGKWINKVPTVNTDNVTNGKALTSTEKTIAITGTGATSLLKDVQIDVANGAITSEKIKDGAVTTGKIEAGKDGEVLVTVTENGKEVTKWVPQKDIVKANETVTTIKGGTNITVNKAKDSYEYTLDVPTATKDVAGVVKAGEGLNVDGAGNLTVNYETAKEKLATGDVTSKSITVTGGDKSTFKNVELEITAGANKGDVLVTGDNGKVEWITKKDATSNVLKSDGNTLTSTVNGKDSNAVSIVNSVGNTLNDKNELVTTVNGVSSTTAIDLTPAIQAGQKTTVVTKGTGVTVDTKVEGKVTTYTVSADSSTISLDGDVTGTADNTTISKLQGKELVTTNVVEGNVLVFDGTKWVTKTPTVDASNVGKAANLTTDGIIVVDTDKTSSEGSLLKAAKLSIKAGGITANELATNAVTSEKINAGAVTPGKIEGGTNGQVLTTTVSTEGTKTVEWKTPTVNTTGITGKGNLTSTTENLLTVTDGTGAVLQNVSLTVNEGSFNISNMKGDLTVNRIEAGNDNQVLTTVGTGKDAKVVWTNKDKPVVVQPADGITNNSNVIVTPGSGDKANEYTVDVKAAMPKVFYMPPVMFNTRNKVTAATRNLYNEYKAMFTGDIYVDIVDMPKSTDKQPRPALVSNPGANGAKIPVYNQTDLNFYVAYYDPAVFANVSVSDEGVLTYDIIEKAKYGAFMTVVFVVK